MALALLAVLAANLIVALALVLQSPSVAQPHVVALVLPFVVFVPAVLAVVFQPVTVILVLLVAVVSVPVAVVLVQVVVVLVQVPVVSEPMPVVSKSVPVVSEPAVVVFVLASDLVLAEHYGCLHLHF